MKLPIVLLLITTIGSAQEIIDRVVPITEEPSHHLVLENKYVRVFNVEVPPHFATRVHRHDYDYVFVTLGDSDVSNEKVHADPVELKLKDGETHFTPGGFAHKAVNLADTPFHNITIEFVQPGLTSGAGRARDSAVSANSAGNVFADSQTIGKIKVQDRTFLNGEVSTCTGDGVVGSRLLVPVSQFLVKSAKRSNQLIKPGEVMWFSPGDCATILSRGNFPAHFIIVNFPEESVAK